MTKTNGVGTLDRPKVSAESSPVAPIQLDVRERLILSEMLLTTRGDITTIRIIAELQTALSFDEAEHKALSLVNNGQQIRWDRSKEVTRTFDIGPVAIRVITAALQRLSAEGELTLEHLTLLEKFAVEPAEVE